MEEDPVRTRLIQNVHDLRREHEKAQKQIDDARGLIKLLDRLCNEIYRYHLGASSDEAVFIVAKCQVLLDDFQGANSIVNAYDTAVEKLEEYETRRAIENG